MDWTIGPKNTWDKLATWLRRLGKRLPSRPTALVVISGHWQMPTATLTGHQQPPLIYDYHGFPRSTYKLRWPAAGDPQLAQNIIELLKDANIDANIHPKRGFDHGVFVPLKVTFPEADIPTIQLSLVKGLKPDIHLDIGRALAPLRERDVLIIGSGMSYHNMKKFMTPGALQHSQRFNNWIEDCVALPEWERDAELCNWMRAPSARNCHPIEDHLLPLMVVAGAAGEDRGKRVFSDTVMGAVVSAIQFG